MPSPVLLGFPLILAVITMACAVDPPCPRGTVTVDGKCSTRLASRSGGPAPDAGSRRKPGEVDPLDGGRAADAAASSSGAGDSGAIDASLRLDASATSADRDAGTDGASPNGDACIPRHEVCNGLDDDCDGDIDDGVLVRFTLDQDGDGFGAGTAILACKPPSAKHTTQMGDCDDDCLTCFPGALET